ncbi:hypothetical protein EON77_09705 [bacterium]|nr:MAG: hypothetical protein EON77_09705 [bacterium]
MKSDLASHDQRAIANDKIQALDEFEHAPFDKLDKLDRPARDAGGASTGLAPDAGVATPRRTAAAASTSPAAPREPRDGGARATTGGGDMEKVRQYLLQGSQGYDAARALLEKKLAANHASVEELQALKAICKAQGDKACTEHCKQLLGQ